MKDMIYIFIISAVIALLLAAVVSLVFGDNKIEVDPWDKFKTEHHCKITDRMDGDTVTGVGMTMNGSMALTVGSTPGKTGWTCDDGVRYWK